MLSPIQRVALAVLIPLQHLVMSVLRHDSTEKVFRFWSLWITMGVKRRWTSLLSLCSRCGWSCIYPDGLCESSLPSRAGHVGGDAVVPRTTLFGNGQTHHRGRPIPQYIKRMVAVIGAIFFILLGAVLLYCVGYTWYLFAFARLIKF